SLAVVPVYIHFLGIEAYGLIGFFLSLTAILSLLDLGLGTALNRQFAQYSAQSGNARSAAHFGDHLLADRDCNWRDDGHPGTGHRGLLDQAAAPFAGNGDAG